MIIPMGLISTQIVEEWVDMEYIDSLAADMKQKGQREPVPVSNCGDHYFLEDGAHRFFAARRLRWLTIDAVIVTVNYDRQPGRARLVEGGSSELKDPVNDYWAKVLEGKRENKTGNDRISA